MKRVYTTPVVAFEAYSLTSQIAGACADAKKTPIGDVKPITVTGTTVHCVIADTATISSHDIVFVNRIYSFRCPFLH